MDAPNLVPTDLVPTAAVPLDVPATSSEYGELNRTSVKWAFGGRLCAQAIQLAGTIALGRLVSPSAFGILAAAAVFLALGTIFTDLGLGPAIVHKKSPTDSYLSTAYWINAGSGVVLSAITCLLAWPLSAWYHMPQLKWVLPIVGLAFSFSVSTVGMAILERRFRFREIAIAEIGAATVGQGAAITVASFHPSVLALAVGPVVNAATLSVIIFWLSDWRPRFSYSRSDFKELRSYAGYLGIFNVITFSARNADDFLLGRFVTTAQLGFYSRSYQLMLLPVAQINQTLTRVLQPSFAKARNSRQELQRLHTSAELLAAAVGFPVAIVFVTFAPSAIPLILGTDWRPMVHIFQILALSVPAQVLGVVNGSLYTATGNVRLLLTVGLISSSALIAIIASSVTFGTTAVAVGFTIHAYCSVPLALVPIVRRMNLKVRPMLPGILAISLATFCLWLLLSALPTAFGQYQAGTGRFVSQLSILLFTATALFSAHKIWGHSHVLRLLGLTHQPRGRHAV